jgi:hypothetical protein
MGERPGNSCRVAPKHRGMPRPGTERIHTYQAALSEPIFMNLTVCWVPGCRAPKIGRAQFSPGVSGVIVGWLGQGPLWSRKRPLETAAATSGMCQKQKSPAPSIGSRRQRGEDRLGFRDLGKLRGRRMTLERRREPEGQPATRPPTPASSSAPRSRSIHAACQRRDPAAGRRRRSRGDPWQAGETFR